MLGRGGVLVEAERLSAISAAVVAGLGVGLGVRVLLRHHEWLVMVIVGGRSLPEEFLSQLKALLLGLG